MKKLKAVESLLLFAFADVTIWLQASILPVYNSAIKTYLNLQIGDDSKKGPPGINKLLTGHI